ncbi:hypothetical protein [Streptomyces sp. NPDC008150]|uniref:hypothetical protein n=1 Tax=Streptomyces sp. NPDC008150 TaxID=3364816 RepID=UPI0036EAA818
MPGRLPVAYRDAAARISHTDVPLADVPTDTVVTAAGTITTVRHLDPFAGRVMVVITDDHGDSAHVSLDPDIARTVGHALRTGARMTVRGTVTRTTTVQPAGIDALGIRVVNL